MVANIINKAKVEEHSVQRYRFKVLSTNLGEATDTLHVSEEEMAENNMVLNVDPVFDEIAHVVKLEEGQNQFIEELLKKTDELSSNIIKLQMQIEKQEQDFNNRLSEEIQRERENAQALGYQKARDEFELAAQETKSRYFKSITSIDALYKNMEEIFAKMESDMSATAFEIAKEVIKKELIDSSSKVAIALSRELLKELKEASKIELKVNPKDLEDLKEAYLQNEKIKVTSDDSITLGGVVILSDVGNLDGNLAMRLEKIKYLIQDN